MSNVFRKIKNNDVHQRPFKAYKSYKISNNDIGVGYVTQSAIFYDGRIDQDGKIPYPTNSDNTNMYVSWHSIKQKFYDHRPTAIPEHVLNPLNERALYVSASHLSIPYNEVGERIKNNTFKVTSSIGELTINLQDDGNGNLIDDQIDSTTFATASKNFFYVSFNNYYDKVPAYRLQTGNFTVPGNFDYYTGKVNYLLHGTNYETNVYAPTAQSKGIQFIPGITVAGSDYSADSGTGLGVKIRGNGSGIVIPHHESFDRLGPCDDWTISFWHKNNSTAPVIAVSASMTLTFKNTGGTGTTHTIGVKNSANDTTTFESQNGTANGTVLGNSNIAFDGLETAAADIAENFAEAVNSVADLDILAVQSGADVKLVQLTPGTAGNTTVVASSAFNSNILESNAPNFTGGEDEIFQPRYLIMSKWGNQTEYFSDRSGNEGGTLKTKTSEFHSTTLAYSASMIETLKVRTPLHITTRAIPSASSQLLEYEFAACDGTIVTSVSSSVTWESEKWNHVVILHKGGVGMQMFVNGEDSSASSVSTIPANTANDKNLVIGNSTSTSTDGDIEGIAEIRFYDYNVSDEERRSLANNNYISASCYQTNIVGNVFHRNGAAVVSSPLPKYHSGSGIFGDDHTWNAKWRGTHTIYENQAFVRVPKDVLNVSMNPSATFTPATNGGDICTTNQQNTLPGEQRKDLFVSGTLKPYITTIGLYNDQSELLAVGKLAQPIQKRDDIDMNFVIRWDY